MLFNSLPFLIFFPVVTILYFLLPHKYRWAWLLAASCFFYMFFKPIYIFILFFTIIIDYYAGIWIENAEGPKKKQYLAYSLVANIGVLAIFKYYNFINGNIDGLATLMGFKNPIPYLSILLPVGLSFHTFQAMSYTIEVYRGNQKAEKHFGIYSLYVMFYPQLVAGPIERPQNILHQFYEKHQFNFDNLKNGLLLISWGLFKKVVVADRLSMYVNSTFENLTVYKGFPLLWTMIFFTFQIYCDFSGYSDIALGTARVMGFDLMKNFNQPFLAVKLSDYWRRWHISLYSWFNDYLYNPIVIKYRDYGNWAIVLAIMVTFSLSGLWHGASWTFILWGTLHGVGLVFEALTKKKLVKIKKATNVFLFENVTRIITLLFLGFTFFIFRAHHFSEIVYFCKNIYKIDSNIIGNPIFSKLYFYLNFAFIFIIIISDNFFEKNWVNYMPFKDKINYTFIAFFFIFLSIYLFGIFEEQSFIYFQF
ncbi:MAG: MBOAT family O-acyltransferase [Bacteroidota bacterium]